MAELTPVNTEQQHKTDSKRQRAQRHGKTFCGYENDQIKDVDKTKPALFNRSLRMRRPIFCGSNFIAHPSPIFVLFDVNKDAVFYSHLMLGTSHVAAYSILMLNLVHAFVYDFDDSTCCRITKNVSCFKSISDLQRFVGGYRDHNGLFGHGVLLSAVRI